MMLTLLAMIDAFEPISAWVSLLSVTFAVEVAELIRPPPSECPSLAILIELSVFIEKSPTAMICVLSPIAVVLWFVSEMSDSAEPMWITPPEAFAAYDDRLGRDCVVMPTFPPALSSVASTLADTA